MFVVSTFRNTIRIHPADFAKDPQTAIADEINRLYANKVVLNIGLCICLYDLTEVGDAYIVSSDGSTRTEVVFRLIVFRPFEGEVVSGTIRRSIPSGIIVNIGTFFDDVFIPAENLQPGTIFNPDLQEFVWTFAEQELRMEADSRIRFRVVADRFSDLTPVHTEAPRFVDNDIAVTRTVASAEDPYKRPYMVIGSASDSGLGLEAWWE
ncbi:hypothetical protein CAOG_07999 [Capsaspora owczarzaki ATCC 30864]|uniref:DNA-directed RNA polymerase III subunit RPC8 n=1 Tax=Capsaspora owczarzaki (strain ATCC 30864) TaxID=595528 RepID=A0A0D2W100_CAPO3|nr:hypothetical protein CAOG_07999 [Capsaspora owczarzaki ATCC 30864]KJE97932.1 hypothetical protein CAOG_007999 [Capsaspora owczarzaki ATCC 30864]|eukprot:XP_004342600.1 hypothetical protein CAOG_07999 [Capsaspora owczarzaki ATCC 30864]